jgi:MFS family permease
MEPAEISPELRKGRNQLAATVIFGHAVKHVFNSSLPLLLTMLKSDMNLTATQYGVIAGIGRGTSGATTMVAGYLGERFANRAGLMLFVSLSMMGISYFLLGIAPSYWWVLAAMMLVGIGPSLYHPPAIASLSRKFPDRRGFAISLHGTGGSVGEMLGPIVVGLLTTEAFKVGSIISITYLVAFKWNEVLRISVVPALVFAVLVYLLMRNIPTADSETGSIREYFGDLGILLKDKIMLGLIFVTAFRAMGQASIMYFLPLYLFSSFAEGGLGKDQLTVGFYMAGAQVTGIAAQPIMGWLSDRYGRKIVLVPAMTLLGILYISLSFATDGLQLIFNVLALGAFVYSLHTIFIAAAMDVARGKAQSTVVSLIYGASFFGTVSPIIAGFLVDSYGIKSSFIYSGIVALASTLILVALKLPKTINQQELHS